MELLTQWDKRPKTFAAMTASRSVELSQLEDGTVNKHATNRMTAGNNPELRIANSTLLTTPTAHASATATQSLPSHATFAKNMIAAAARNTMPSLTPLKTSTEK